jgi:predicted PurR-regulated permease PerM
MNTMKRLVLYSLTFTGIVIIFGLFFIYGVFDFSQGKAELITTMHSSSEMDLHNDVVDHVHDIGNLTTEIFEINNVYEIGTKVEKIEKHKNELTSIIENRAFTKKQEQIKENFYEIYQPALETWVNEATRLVKEATAEPEEGEEVVEEKEEIIFQDAIKAVHELYIEAHNEYTNVLNKARKY